MAKATLDKTVRVTLELDEDEAETLLGVHNAFIAGHPSGPRGVLDRIGHALTDAGVIPRSGIKALPDGGYTSLWLAYEDPKEKIF